MLKVELLELCRMHRPLPTYVVDETLKQHGHTAIRMPPYHAELNSIELIWAMLKGKVARSNLTFKKKHVKKLTEDAFESISPEDWASCCRHVKDVEKQFYATDIAVDDQVDRLVIIVTSSDEDTDTASDCDGGSTDDERTDTVSGGHEAS